MQHFKRSFLTTLILLVLLGTGPALAQMGDHYGESEKGHPGMQKSKGHGSGGGYGKGHNLGPNWHDSLSKKQKKMANEMHLQLKKETSALKATKALRKVELNILITSDNPDMTAIETKIEELVNVKKQIMMKKYSHKVKMRAMLNEDQRISFDMGILGGGHRRHK